MSAVVETSSTDMAKVAELLEIRDRTDGRGRPQEIIAALERGDIIFLPAIGFELTARERELICDEAVVLPGREERESESGRPTLIFDRDRGRIERTRIAAAPRRELEAMMHRFGEWADQLLADLAPAYSDKVDRDRITFRPSNRSRTQGMHVDSSYGHPSQGRGMLRVFTNINVSGRPRQWQIGERFEPFVERFLPRVPAQIRSRGARLLEFLGITRGRQTPYDRLMAEIRRVGKNDESYQTSAPRRIVTFPSGSTWIAITDLVVHGAMSGQFSLDQTYFLPLAAMEDRSRSSLAILERMTGKTLT
ncbi:MAG TPA: Kdo hydroxylase family protein [Terriglobales bacterium]|nr:Kdo hydroxylase family protein [Terriglobales bacterium]